MSRRILTMMMMIVVVAGDVSLHPPPPPPPPSQPLLLARSLACLPVYKRYQPKIITETINDIHRKFPTSFFSLPFLLFSHTSQPDSFLLQVSVKRSLLRQERVGEMMGNARPRAQQEEPSAPV